MSAIVYLIEQIANGLYIILGVGLLLSLRAVARTNGEFRAAHFELERDIARFQRLNAYTSLILLGQAALLVFGIQNVVAPALRAVENNEVAIAGIISDGTFVTPTPQPFTGGVVIDTSNVQLGVIDPAAQILPTPTLTPTPVGTIIPNAPAANCPDPNVQLQIPANGMIVFQPIAVIGLADAPNFAFYRFELNGESTFGSWATIGIDGTNPVRERGALGQFAPSFYAPGEYRFRVTVFDITATQVGECAITIYISAPIPTPTPLAPGAP